MQFSWGITLNFTLYGYPMGSEVVLAEGQKPNFSVIARGSDLIDFIETLKWDFDEGIFDKEGHPIFETVLHNKVKALDVDMDFIDNNYKNYSLYYLRLKQLFKLRGQEVWAWSSPIWAFLKPPPEMVVDFDCDGDIDETDAASFKADFSRNQHKNPCTNNNPCNGDFDCDGDVDWTDAEKFKEAYDKRSSKDPCPP